MRLDFNVLWIDDLPGAIQSSVQRLERSMRTEGFQLRPTIVSSVSDAIARLQGDVFSDQIDLVVVDFDLGHGKSGDVGLREIRARVAYKEIVFYSAKAAADLKELAHRQGVEGVYCCSRNDLVETATGVFETLVKKVLDLDHTRGIVMGATSDIDHLVHETVLALHQAQDEAGKARIRAAAVEQVQEKLARLNAAGERVKGALEIGQIFELHDLLTAADKLKMLIRELKRRGDEKLKPMRTMLAGYHDNVIPKRNLLGHVRMHVTAEGSRILRARDGRELTQDQLRELRRELIAHRDNFFALAETLAKAT
jgi:hypothetical protein